MNDDTPNYGIDVQADELLAELAERADDYGRNYEEKRRWWTESLEYHQEHTEARYWMHEARGGQRALADVISQLHPGGRFRNADGTVDVRGLMRWVNDRADAAHDRSHGPYTETRHADEAETAYVSVLSLLRDDYGVGWPRLDEHGNALAEDMA